MKGLEGKSVFGFAMATMIVTMDMGGGVDGIE